MWNDLRHAVRLLRREAGFTVAVVLILALGIGANSAIFTAIDQTVVRPLAWRDPGQLVAVWEDFSAFGVPRSRVSPGTFIDWRRRTNTFRELAAYAGPRTMDLAGGGPPEEVRGISVTANLLGMLGVPPLLGRNFAAEEEHLDSRLLILSYRLWQRRFTGDRRIVGTSISMDGAAWTVIGVMPPGFQFPDRDTEYWVPISLTPQVWARRNSHFLKVIGRMKPGRTAADAQSDMSAVARQMELEFPAANARIGIAIVPLKEQLLGESRLAFMVLLATAGLMLLLAVANVANLLLARATRRSHEMAIRTALGAARWRLIRQMLAESFVLSLTAGALGLLIARWGLAALERMVPDGLPGGLTIDTRVLTFTMLVSTLTGIAFGLAPALRLVRNTAAASRTFTGRNRVRDVLVVAEIAVAFILVVGAALLIRTLGSIHAVDTGFRSAGILTAEINIPASRSLAASQRFYSSVLSEVRAIPGVASAGLTSDLPYTSRGNTMSIRIEDQPPAGLAQDVLFRLVSAGYLETIRTRLVEGRTLDGRDTVDASPSVVINETLAQQYWHGQSPLGHRIDTGTGDGQPRWMTIVGVVRDVRERGLDLALKSAVYVPFTQVAIGFFQPSEIAVRTAADPRGFVKQLQRAVWSIDPAQPISVVRTMDEIVESEVANRTQMLQMLGAFAGVALLLAAMGIYSVLSYNVSQRRREIGVRMAIGARRADIAGAILRHSAWMAAVGIAVGGAFAVATTRLLRSLLYGVSPLDWAAFTAVPLVLATVALAASLVPAWRATRVDPSVTLRDE
jgi:predicted permease